MARFENLGKNSYLSRQRSYANFPENPVTPMNWRTTFLVGAVVAVAAFGYFISSNPREASMLLVNGKVYTLDSDNSVEQAIAVRGVTIVDVGSTADMKQRYHTENVVDLLGKTVLPGFIDAHAHMNGLGHLLRSLVLVDAPSPEAILQLLRERIEQYRPGEWIYGRGWDQNLWQEKKFPTAAMLDAVAPNNPVIFVRIDGHACWVNHKAMEMSHVTKETADPEGGRIIRDAMGNPTGVFVDNARDLVEAAEPPESESEIEQNILAAAHACVQVGLTEVGDMGIDSQVIAIYQRLVDEQKLPIRIYAAINAPSRTWTEWTKRKPLVGYGNGMFTVRSVKMYADGALGSRGAALVEDYSDDPGNRGLTMISDQELDENIRMATNQGYQPCVHAIGDRGNHIVLNAYQRVHVNPELRPRIEHAQVLLPDDIPRFHELGVLPSMQPVHATSDMPWAEARLGPERIKGAYAWRSLLNTGVIIPGGSDFPNDRMNPLLGVYAAVTRTDPDGNPPGGWYADQCMTRSEAIRCYTRWAAFAEFEEGSKGTIERGKLADLTVFSNDVMTIPPSELLSTEVELTIVNGEIVYQKPVLVQ